MRIGQHQDSNPKSYFITFGNDLFKNQRERLRNQATELGWFDSIVIESPETIQNFITLHRSFFENNNRGFGYWIWKPYIILRLLNEMKDGDFLFYVDAGATIIHHKKDRFDGYINYLKDHPRPILTFWDAAYTERKFQKAKVLKRFNIGDVTLDQSEEFLDSNQIESGIFICRKCEFTMSFVQEWMDLLIEDNYGLVNDEDDSIQLEGFIGHRHDQSILSILCKLNSTTMWGGEAYGLGPFFSSRITDEGPRKFAPDKFRMEPDYDPLKHKTWADWLADPNVNKAIVP